MGSGGFKAELPADSHLGSLLIRLICRVAAESSDPGSSTDRDPRLQGRTKFKISSARCPTRPQHCGAQEAGSEFTGFKRPQRAEGEIQNRWIGQSRSPGKVPLLSPIFSTEEPTA